MTSDRISRPVLIGRPQLDHPFQTGQSTKVVKCPREITSAWRSFSSISRPSTKPEQQRRRLEART